MKRADEVLTSTSGRRRMQPLKDRNQLCVYVQASISICSPQQPCASIDRRFVGVLPEENAVVWYSLLPGPGYELFSINPYTGLITTTSTLDREQQQRFTLRGRKTQKTAESGRNPPPPGGPRRGPQNLHRLHF